MKDGHVTNVSIDWFSKDIDVMGDTYATNVRPVEVSFIDNEVADPVCGECKIDTKCDSHGDNQVEQEEPCCDSCASGETSCDDKPRDGKNSEDDTMSEDIVKSEAESITEREFASIKNQLNEMTTSYKELESKYEASMKAITDFEEMEAKRANEAEALRKKELVNKIISKEVLLGSLEEDKKDSRFEEMKDWDEPRLSGFSAALENVPVPEETERSFGKGKAREASEAPTEEPERERLISMDKDGKARFNRGE